MLAESLDQMHRSYGDRSAEPNFGENMWPYYLSLGLVLCLIIAFVKALILPTFSFMFEEFGMKETLSFRWLHSSWADMAVMIFPVLIATILLCGWLSRRMGFTRRFRRTIGSFISSRQHRLSQAKTLQLLANSMQGGRPAVGVLATLARFHFDSRVRTQLLFAKNELDLGSSLSDSFSQVGLLSASEAVAIGQLETHADRGWLLGKIAQRSIAKIHHERRLQATFIHPLIIGLFGLATMLVCVAVLSMLIKLITSLS
jgi:type II secretory pathway component PulF